MITVVDTSIFTVGNKYSVMQNDGSQSTGTISSINAGASQLTLGAPLTVNTSNGNIVFDLTYSQLQPSQFPASNGNF